MSLYRRVRVLIALAAAAMLLLCCGVLWFRLHIVHAQEGEKEKEKENQRLIIYSPQATYSVPVLERSGYEYVGVFEVFEPLGGIELKPDGQEWVLQVDTGPQPTEGRFVPGKSEATVRGKAVPLPAPVQVDGERILVSIHSLPVLLSAFLDAKTVLHASGRRLFVNLTGISMSEELKSADPNIPESRSRVVLTFPSPVSPAVTKNGNELHLLFSHEPILPGTDTNFNDPAIKGIHFQETNGALDVTVSGAVPLNASILASGKQITITSMPHARLPEVAATAITPGSGATAAALAVPPPGATASATPKLLIMVDAGHGGPDLGARVSDTVSEKEIVLSLARKLRGELQSRGFNTIMVRDGDVAIPADQRATMANASQPALYINLHAGTAGNGVHVYTSLLRSAAPPVFPLWDSAQAGYVDRSEHIASWVTFSLNQASLTATQGKTGLRPLDNIAAPAIAVELSPLDVGGDTQQITESGYQEGLARAVATALAANREQLGEGP